jgi:hypothetical protein
MHVFDASAVELHVGSPKPAVPHAGTAAARALHAASAVASRTTTRLLAVEDAADPPTRRADFAQDRRGAEALHAALRLLHAPQRQWLSPV